MRSSTPKVLHTLSGKPMLFHAIEASLAISDDVTVILHHQAQRIEETIKKHYEGIGFHQQDALNFPGTGGAMRGVSPKHSRTLILNGDMPLVTSQALIHLLSSDAPLTMSVIELENPHGYGRVIIEQGEVKEIVEQKDCDEQQLATKSVNAGVYSIQTDLLERYIPNITNHNAQKEYYLTDIVKMAVEEGCQVAPIIVEEESFKGVNSKLDLAHAEAIHQKRLKDALMLQGVRMRLPETIYIDCRATIEGESILENGVTIEGASHLFNAHIKAHSSVESATIIDSDIGPMARVRPDTTLTRSHIGNFVEIKKSTLNGVKAGHLSYLGDATIEEGSNIGAGVITCNYDGKSKHRTTIGKNVFVGSDSQLVAPVAIEDDVIIASGTTVTKDGKRGSLLLSRTPQKSIANFFYKFFGKSHHAD
jgi:bifunctional UDP-N-acetylglucosamine pyrophosphorylase/glucosamine-1-phosphate N-acetyltransferase